MPVVLPNIYQHQHYRTPITATHSHFRQSGADLPSAYIEIDSPSDLPYLPAGAVRYNSVMDGNFNIKATKGFWTPERDRKLLQMVRTYGGKLSWVQLAKAFPGVRGKYVRERYRNHLDPQLKTFAWTWDEDQILKKCYLKFGNRWELISHYLPGRSANQVKNRTKRREFRELFPQPPSRKKAWNPTVYPSQVEAKNPKRATIVEEERAMALKQEENHRRLRREIEQQREKQLVEQPPIPQYLQEQARRDKKRKLTKTRKMQLATLHLQRTYDLIKDNLTKRGPSDFYLIFETKTKREIFTKIKAIQWTITQLWPLVTNRSTRQCNDQEIAFFLYCLVKADNTLANKILHRLMKCADEDYLMRKVERIIEDIDKFIMEESEIVRQKEMMQRNNRPVGPKGESLESANTNDTTLKSESPQECDGVGEDILQEIADEGIKKQAKTTDFTFQDQEQPENRVPHQLLPQYDFDFAMLGKLATIGNQIDAKRLEKRAKIEESAVQKRAEFKMETEVMPEMDKESAESQSCREMPVASIVQLSSQPVQSEAGFAYFQMDSSESDPQLEAVAECLQLCPLHFVVSLTQDCFLPQRRVSALPFYELQEISEASSSSGFGLSQVQGEEMGSRGDSSQVLMRVKFEEDQPVPSQPPDPAYSLPSPPRFTSILRNKILHKLQEKEQSKKGGITIKSTV